MNKNRYIIALGIILAAILYRFLPNPVNFSPIGAAFLFGGAVFARSKSWKFLIGMLAFVLLSDLMLNNFVLRSFFPNETGFIGLQSYMIFTFVSYAIIFGIAKLLVHEKNVISIIGGSILGSIVFFLLTNAGAWVFDGLNIYPDNFSGLLASWTAGLPFFKNSLLADLFFSGIFFGSFYLIKSFSKTKQLQEA